MEKEQLKDLAAKLVEQTKEEKTKPENKEQSSVILFYNILDKYCTANDISKDEKIELSIQGRELLTDKNGQLEKGQKKVSVVTIVAFIFAFVLVLLMFIFF